MFQRFIGLSLTLASLVALGCGMSVTVEDWQDGILRERSKSKIGYRAAEIKDESFNPMVDVCLARIGEDDPHWHAKCDELVERTLDREQGAEDLELYERYSYDGYGGRLIMPRVFQTR